MDNIDVLLLIDELIGSDWTIRGEEEPINLKDRGWDFFTSSENSSAEYKRMGGACLPKSKEIFINHYITTTSDNNIKDVCLHEIAHALDIEIRGKSDHSQVFKNICKQVGCKPNTYSTESVKHPDMKYFVDFRCKSNCSYGWFRKPTRYTTDIITCGCKEEKEGIIKFIG